MNTLIYETLASTVLGDPTSCDALTMFPLFGPPAVEDPPSYVTLDEALAAEWTSITEVSEQGRVPELRVVNNGSARVFILDGEELVGAKQNRIVNVSILVPENAALTIPVSCVEAGRWHARSRAFSAAPRTHYATGRAKRMVQVTESLRSYGVRHSDQAAIWADIAEKSERLSARSETAAMAEMYTVHGDFAERCVATLQPVHGQCGALFLIGGRVVGFDLFDRAATLRHLLPKLVRSVAIDALDPVSVPAAAAVPKRDRRGRVSTEGEGAMPSPELQMKIAEHFLERTVYADVHEADAVGLGRELRLVAPQISGAALTVNGALVHLAAFHV